MSAPEFIPCRLCGKCPCLNDDSCNLGFETDLRWTKERRLDNFSKDCGLVCVVVDGTDAYGISSFFPEKELVDVTDLHPNRWTE